MGEAKALGAHARTRATARASWPDALIGWVDRLPIPAWLFVDPLRPRAAHAFSGWTMRFALVLAAYAYSWFGIDPSVETQNSVSLTFDLGFLALAVAVFVLPPWGMHQRLQAEREALLEGATARLGAPIVLFFLTRALERLF